MRKEDTCIIILQTESSNGLIRRPILQVDSWLRAEKLSENLTDYISNKERVLDHLGHHWSRSFCWRLSGSRWRLFFG